MDSISNNLLSGINSTQMPPKGRGKPEPLLAEGESLTKEGFLEALSAKGVNETKIEEIFSNMDTDGNGEISYEEEQAMLEARREENGPPPRFSQQDADSNSIQSVLESILSSDMDDDTKTQINSALENMQTSGYSQKSMSDSISLLNEIFPKLDVRA